MKEKQVSEECEQLILELLEDGWTEDEAIQVAYEEFGYIKKPTNWIT